jgi:hypothetical protein
VRKPTSRKGCFPDILPSALPLRQPRGHFPQFAHPGEISGLALIHGGQLHKIRMPLPSAASDPVMPASLAAIGTTLRARLDGPWNRLDEAAEAEERRVV